MAEALLRHVAATRGLAVEVASAGVTAVEGMPLSQEAASALRRRGVSVGEHRSRRLTPELVAWADLVLVMEPLHREVVVAAVPEAAGKVFLLKEYADPDRFAGLQEALTAARRDLEEARAKFRAAEGAKLEALYRRREELMAELERVQEAIAELALRESRALQRERERVAELEQRMAEASIQDPVGQAAAVYDACADEIRSAVDAVLR
ncbi:MAG: hypothetical protein IRY95_08150, partial [Clostridia bacterium]|nr:hypothetical protein [Clostridia bacterium]